MMNKDLGRPMTMRQYLFSHSLVLCRRLGSTVPILFNPEFIIVSQPRIPICKMVLIRKHAYLYANCLALRVLYFNDSQTFFFYYSLWLEIYGTCQPHTPTLLKTVSENNPYHCNAQCIFYSKCDTLLSNKYSK